MVQRFGLLSAAAALVGVGFLVGGMFAPQVPAQAAPEKKPPSRVGYVLVPRVIAETRRARADADRIGAVQAKYATRVDFLRRDVQARQAELATAQGNRAELERDLVKAQRELEDLDRQARQEIEGLQRKLLAELYREMAAEAAGLAREHGLDAVQTYPALPGNADPMQVHQLLAVPGTPLYVRPDTDYTSELIQRLDQRYAATEK